MKIIQVPPTWVSTEELAESMKPRGELCTNVAEIGIFYVNDHCKGAKKTVYSFLMAKFLLEGNMKKKYIELEFGRNKDFALSCQEIVSLYDA